MLQRRNALSTAPSMSLDPVLHTGGHYAHHPVVVRGHVNRVENRMRQAAAKDKEQRFSVLWHHVYDVDRLREENCHVKAREQAIPIMSKASRRRKNQGNSRPHCLLHFRCERNRRRAGPARTRGAWRSKRDRASLWTVGEADGGGQQT